MTKGDGVMPGRIVVLFCLLASSFAVLAFEPIDIIVSNPVLDLRQPEFDARTKRMIWQDRLEYLWIADVDPVTGAIHPKDGKGTRIDTNLSPLGEVQNTPRYTWGTDGGYIIYTKDAGDIDLHLAMAEEVEPGVWMTSLLENGENRFKANGSPEETPGPARIVYNRITPEGDIVTSWRELLDPTTEQSAIGVEGGRFLGGEPAVVLMAPDENDIIQIFVVPFDTGIPEQISFESQSNFNAFIWYAPEYEDYLITSMINFTRLGIYRRIDGKWTKIHEYRLPTSKPFVSSEEAFVVNGKSFITVVAAEKLGAGNFLGQPVGPSEIWVTSIDTLGQFFRRIDDPSYEAQRSEPEPYLLESLAVVYYTELKDKPDPQLDIRLLKMAVTGLKDQTGYDGTAWGGNWASGLRDSKNCNCTPYAILDDYRVAASVSVPNTQFMHPVLGPEGNLYFGIANNDGQSFLVAVDTNTATEKYRLDESQAGADVHATTPLIASLGDYYVPANDGLRKFNSKGQMLWHVPTRGLARGAQFLGDGNVIFFTWNGWAYIVSPEGEILLEKYLTPGRTYPDEPTCLRNMAPKVDCAYIAPPAVHVAGKTVYATQVRRTGESVIQAFKYDSKPDVTLTDLWGENSPVLPGVVTTPVLADDYSRIYVHDGNGILRALDSQTGEQIWGFALGYTTDQPPVVTPNGYLMPGGTVDENSNHKYVGIVKDNGDTASWALKSLAYAPRSYAAAGKDDRFVLAARRQANGQLLLLVVEPDGVVSATPWGNGEPTTLKGVTLREDGRVMVQAVGQVGVKIFQPER
jgi:outer membrane protein assembly factor BamB